MRGAGQARDLLFRNLDSKPADSFEGGRPNGAANASVCDDYFEACTSSRRLIAHASSEWRGSTGFSLP